MSEALHEDGHFSALGDLYLLDDIALPHRDQIRPVEGANHLATGHCREALDPIEVGVFDGHHSVFGKYRLGEVVNQLPIYENVAPVRDDLVALLTHSCLSTCASNAKAVCVCVCVEG